MNMAWQFGALVLVFSLAIVLGLQIQISGLYRELDDIRRNLAPGGDAPSI